MTFLDSSPSTATAGLAPASEDIETSTGEMVGLGFQREALERNYWETRERRISDRRKRMIGDISEAVYGTRDGWKASPQAVPQNQGLQTIGSAMREGADAVAEDQQTLDQLFVDLEALRISDPGSFANFPTGVADLDASAAAHTREEMLKEIEDLERRTENRSSPSFGGAAAEFVGMAGAAVSDIEGLATLPFGAGAGSLGRTVVIEGLLGAGSEALALPAYNEQAEFLGREAPNPALQLLFGATFGGALPLAGRALKDGAGLAASGARASNRALLDGARRISGSDKVRGAAAALARDEAALDSTPEGIEPVAHVDAIDQAQVMLDSGAPVVVRPQTVVPNEQSPISDRLMFDLGEALGLEDFQVAGIVGNLGHESGGFETLQELAPLIPGSAGGFGYAQWTGPRRRAFEAWADENGLDVRSYKANLGFLLHELTETDEGAVLDKLRGAKNAAEATQIFSDTFLRPGIPHMDSRLAWTERVLGGDIGAVDGAYQGQPRFVRSGGPDGTGISGRSAEYDGAAFSADEDGFEIRVGQTSFARPWTQEGDRVYSALADTVTEAALNDNSARRPLTNWLSNGHRSKRGDPPSGQISLQIDPYGPIGRELKNADITRQSYPRLFRAGGLKNMDNFPAKEWEERLPGITDATGSRDPELNGYLSEQGLIDLLVREAAGDSEWLPSRAEFSARRTDLQNYADQKQQGAKVFDPSLSDGSPAQTRAMISEIESAIDAEIDARGLRDLVNDETRAAITQQILRNGGSVEDAIDDIRDVELLFAEADLESDDGRQFAQYSLEDFEGYAAPRGDAVPKSDGHPEYARQDAGAARRGDAGEATDRSRSESTAAGEQYLTPGVAPVDLRDQLEAQQSQRLTGGNAPAIDGLFDVNGRSQRDIFSDMNQPDVGSDLRTPALFDDPVESSGVTAQVELIERDVRAFAAAADDVDQTFPAIGPDGPTVRVADVLQDIDDETDFLEQLQICMPKGVANG